MARERSKGYSRRKGHGFERTVAIWLRGVFPGARRHLEYHQADATGIDLDHTGRYKIQCKRLKDYAPIRRLFEVQCDEKEMGHIPVLVTKADDQRPVCVLPVEEFIRLIKIAQSVSPHLVD